MLIFTLVVLRVFIISLSRAAQRTDGYLLYED